jgi:hypothetical protein
MLEVGGEKSSQGVQEKERRTSVIDKKNEFEA